MARGELTLATGKRLEMIDLTDRLQQAAGNIDEGVLHVYNPHTTAGLIINEGADPDVQRDILGA
ncbi:MAG: YjbQ family protein, partial [Proteobacteria bacterium]|nr:YjbQ family protein [Pseudomonadota bacterium]